MATTLRVKLLRLKCASQRSRTNFARLTVTEEEITAYNKVAALVAARGGGAAATPALSPQNCTISPSWNCWIFIGNCHITPIRPIINDCIPFTPGPASTGVGFGRLGGD